MRLQARRPRPKGYPVVLRTLGDHLRACRMDRDLTQTEVAELLRVTSESVGNWEHCRYPPKAEHSQAIHAFLGYCPVGLDLSNMGARPLAWRRTKGLSQLQVAVQLGCDETTLRAIERGRTRFLHRRTRQAIERLLGRLDD